jgi:hypothetical protein
VQGRLTPAELCSVAAAAALAAFPVGALLLLATFLFGMLAVRPLNGGFFAVAADLLSHFAVENQSHPIAFLGRPGSSGAAMTP